MKRHPVPTLLPPIGLNSGPVAVEVVARIFRLNATVQTLGYPVQRRPETHITDATGPKRLGDASIIMETVTAVQTGDHAVLGGMPLLSIGQRAERARMSRKYASAVSRVESPLGATGDTRRSAAGRPGHERSEIVDQKTADR